METRPLSDEKCEACEAHEAGILSFATIPHAEGCSKDRTRKLLPNEFRCAACHEIFDKGRPDEVAKAEALANGYDPDDNCDLTCDVCYHKHFAKYVNVNGAAAMHDETRELLAKEHGPHLLTAHDGTQAYCSGDHRSCKFCAHDGRYATPIYYLELPTEQRRLGAEEQAQVDELCSQLQAEVLKALSECPKVQDYDGDLSQNKLFREAIERACVQWTGWDDFKQLTLTYTYDDKDHKTVVLVSGPLDIMSRISFPDDSISVEALRSIDVTVTLEDEK